MHKGSCLCGAIRFQYDGDIEEVSMCHCSQCQKAQGSAFAAVCPVDDSLLVIEGKDHLREFESSPGKIRAFCQHCGSPIYSARPDLPGIKRLRIGILDSPINPDKRYHKHVESGCDWYEITDELPQYPQEN